MTEEKIEDIYKERISFMNSKITKKRSVLNTLLENSTSFCVFVTMFVIAIYNAILYLILSNCFDFFSKADNFEKIMYLILIGVLLPIAILLFYFAVFEIKLGFSKVNAIIRYIKLPLTTEELQLGVEKGIFSNTKDYLQYIENSLGYNSFNRESEEFYIHLNMEDVYQILKSIKDVFNDDHIDLVWNVDQCSDNGGFKRNENAVNLSKNLKRMDFWKSFDDVSPYPISRLNYIAKEECFPVSVSIDPDNERTLLFKVSNNLFQIRLDHQDKDVY